MTGQERIEKCREIVATCSYKKVDGQVVDLFSANAIVTVNDALSEENQAKYQALPITKMASVAFKLVQTAGGR